MELEKVLENIPDNEIELDFETEIAAFPSPIASESERRMDEREEQVEDARDDEFLDVEEKIDEQNFLLFSEMRAKNPYCNRENSLFCSKFALKFSSNYHNFYFVLGSSTCNPDVRPRFTRFGRSTKNVS